MPSQSVLEADVPAQIHVVEAFKSTPTLYRGPCSVNDQPLQPNGAVFKPKGSPPIKSLAWTPRQACCAEADASMETRQ